MRCDGGEDAPRHQEGITSETSQGDIAENIPQGHRRTSDGDYDIQATEESLHRCVVLHGTSSAQTQAIAADLVVAYNHLGMKRLSENDIKVLKLYYTGRLRENGTFFSGRFERPVIDRKRKYVIQERWGYHMQ